jgi:hypothetical protein
MSVGVSAVAVAGTALAFLLGAGEASAAAPSGCVSCHTDEARLVRSLTRIAAKKSALQSGAG